jgi:hypothetical protein
MLLLLFGIPPVVPSLGPGMWLHLKLARIFIQYLMMMLIFGLIYYAAFIILLVVEGGSILTVVFDN